MSQNKNHISTGQAADMCSVTADTVLKWIKSGRIPANRTPGGHYRIHRQTLINIIDSGVLQGANESTGRAFQFCWEFYGKEGLPKKECFECIAYSSRAMRCYEVSQLSTEMGHAKTFCDNTCDNCEYYRVVQGQRLNILVVTRNQELKGKLEAESKGVDFNIKVIENEYKCSMAIQNFRADYVILDSALGVERWKELAEHLNKDPRIPFIKIILATNDRDIPQECEKLIFAIINNPFEIRNIDAMVGSTKSQTMQ